MAKIDQIETSLHEPHPWDYHIGGPAKTLIVGTFPTAAHNRAFNFFYPNKLNLFWKIMSSLAAIELDTSLRGEEAVIARKSILNKLNAGVTDMGLIVARKNSSSRDEHLEAIKYVDVLGILRKFPSIRTIILTSSSGKVSAAKWFKSYLEEQGIEFSIPKGKKPVQTELALAGRKVLIAIVASPSRRAANRYPISALIDMYGKYIL